MDDDRSLYCHSDIRKHDDFSKKKTMKTLFIRSFGMVLCLVIAYSAIGQVSGLSYTISPLVEYNRFSDNSGLKDGYFGGAQLGFGFGEYVELRANYVQGFNVETDVNNFDIALAGGIDSMYNSRSVDVNRIGGELKLNLSRSKLLPYITVGTGVQNLTLQDADPSKQIYLSYGGGIVFSAANRYTIGLQALNTSYRSNPIQSLLTSDDRDLLGAQSNEILDINNLALRGSLQFYLGGRKPGELSDLDKAYYDNFSGGFRGLSVPVEASLTKINWHESLGFRDAMFGGASAGINIGPLVGVRGFYWKALQDGSYSNFDDLAMYGGEGRFKLNEGKGFTPWITLGGGKIDVGDTYVGRDSMTVADKAFAMGGLGIDLPFSKYVKATGYVRSILTSSGTVDEVTTSEDVISSLSYGVSLNFVLGKSKKVNDASEAYKQAIVDQKDGEYALATEELKEQYDAQLSKLLQQLNQAIAEQDIQAIQEINKEKERVEQVMSTIPQDAPQDAPQEKQKEEKPIKVQSEGTQESIIRMTPAEFQLLLRDIMDMKAAGAMTPVQPVQPATDQSSVQDAINDYRTEDKFAALQKRIEELSASIVELNNSNKLEQKEIADQARTTQDKLSVINKELVLLTAKYDAISKIEGGNNKGQGTAVNAPIVDAKMDLQDEKLKNVKSLLVMRIDELAKEIDAIQENVTIMSEEGTPDYLFPAMISNTQNVKLSNELAERSGFFSKLTYKGMSGIAGFNLGGNATANVGYRMHYAVGNPDSTKVEFMPETFFGFGSPSAFGIMANVTHALPFLTKSDVIKPYIGAGVGFMKVGEEGNDDKLKGAYNFIFGTYLDVWKGDLFVDLTARNFFKYNQLAVGYRFPF